MSLPLQSPAQPIPIAGMAPLLARMPAVARAALRWTQPGLQEASRRLRAEPLGDELIAAVAESVWVPYQSIFEQLVKSFAANQEAYRSIIQESMSQTTRTISAALEGDTDTIDTLEWVAEWLRAYQGMLLYSLPHVTESIGEVHMDPASIAMFCRAPEGGVFRALVLLGAAEDEAGAGGDQGRVRELVELAFLDLCRGVDASREAMPWMPSFPFPGESPGERGARVRRYAEAFRTGGSSEARVAFHAALDGRST